MPCLGELLGQGVRWQRVRLLLRRMESVVPHACALVCGGGALGVCSLPVAPLAVAWADIWVEHRLFDLGAGHRASCAYKSRCCTGAAPQIA